MTRTAVPPVEFVVTPRFDIFYALYSISSVASTAVDGWKAKAKERLPRDFDRSALRIAPLPIFWPLLADCIQGVSGEMTFPEILSTIGEISVEDLQRNILSGIFHDRAAVDSLLAGRRSLKQAIANDDAPGTELLTHFGLRPYDDRSAPIKAIASLLTKPESFRDELAHVLRSFWQTGFESDWTALEPRLRADALRMRDLSDRASAADLARDLNLPVAFDDEAGEVRPRSGPGISYDRIERCYIVSSAFNARRWWAKYEAKGGRTTLYLPVVREPGIANTVAKSVRQSVQADRAVEREINAESVFRALGDTTRYAIASILARAPTTSAELARSLNVSKPTITHHVQALRSAGLLSETPEGGSTKLSLRVDTVAALSGAAVDQLFASTGDLPLATTRKRRGG
jgi:DNA-binding transcriptional ArsR family regulator